MNFAYTIVETNKSSDMQDFVTEVINNNSYFVLSDDSTIQNLLQFKPGGYQHILFNEEQLYEDISKIIFQDEKNGSRTYNFADAQSRTDIQNINEWQEQTGLNLEKIEQDLESLNNSINDPESGVLKELEDKLISFTDSTSGLGLVPAPDSISSGNRKDYYLNANGEWTKISLFANAIPMSESESKTIYQEITDLKGGAKLTISNVTSSGPAKVYVLGVTGTTDNVLKYSTGVYIDAINNIIKGAAWNDIAEFRHCLDKNIEPGTVVVECGKDNLTISTKRLQAGACIISDTYGLSIGETDFEETPIAIAGRVLAYPCEDIGLYNIGDPVCSGPNGTISKMTRTEVVQYPDRIVGTVSSIPTYEDWHGIKVDGRIWIKVR